MDGKNRVFNFSKEVTYIEHQEVTVEAGAVFYNGPKQGGRKMNGEEQSADIAPARELLMKAQECGWLDENMQPLISQNKVAILASVIADEAGMRPRWAPFEQLWGIDNLANKLSHAQMCKYYSESLKEFERCLSAPAPKGREDE